MHCIKGRTICRMLCNFWFGMLGGLVVYSFTFLLDLAWFNLIDYFPCVWLLSLQIESHQEWVWYFLLDHTWQYFTIWLVLMELELLMSCHLFFWCVPAVSTCFLILLLKHFTWWPRSKRHMEKFTSATGCMERAENQKISHLYLAGQYLSF